MSRIPSLKSLVMLVALCVVAGSIWAKATAAPSGLQPRQGTDNYKDLVLKGDIYVDKTFLIKDILLSQKTTILITRPRRWGKSVNLSMLYHFLNREVDNDGNLIEQNSNLVLFEGGNVVVGNNETRVLGPTKLTQDPLWETQLKVAQGSYPVIFFSLKDVKDGSYEKMETSLRAKISTVFREHGYLNNILEARLKDPAITPQTFKVTRSDLATFDRLMEYDGQNASVRELRDSLKFLSRLLYEYHGKRAYILIDEYDSPLNEAYANGYFEEAAKLFGGLFGAALKSNDYLEKGVVTGILRVAKANLFSELNNFGEDSLLQSPDRTNSLAPYYGFTREEVRELLQKAGKEKRFKEIKAYYNGYNIKGIEIYNPWSIVSFLNDNELRSYWVDSGGTALLDKAVIQEDIQEDIRALREGKSIAKTFPTDITMFNIDSDHRVLWALLLYAGYLTTDGSVFQNHGQDTSTARLRVPNTEVQSQFSAFLRRYLDKKGQFSVDAVNTLVKANSLYDAVLNKSSATVKEVLLATDFASKGWNLNALHLAALMGDNEVFQAVYEEHPGLLKSKGQEGLTVKDFAFLAGHQFDKLKGYKTTLEQPGWTEAALCSGVTKWAVVAGIAFLTKKAMRMAMDARQPVAPAPQQGRGGRNARIPVVGQQVEFWQRWGMRGLEYALPIGLGFFSKQFAAQRFAGDCQSYNAYHAIDISKPSSMNTLRQFQKYRIEHPESYVVPNTGCKAKDISIASVDIAPFDLKPAPVKMVKLTLCQPHQRDAAL